jgi:hypothetical protein
VRVCARFAIAPGPGERPQRPESTESGKTYPRAILVGPRIIAIDSPSIADNYGRRRTYAGRRDDGPWLLLTASRDHLQRIHYVAPHRRTRLATFAAEIELHVYTIRAVFAGLRSPSNG